MKQPFLPLENILGAAISRDDAYAAIRADASSHKLFSSFPPDEQECLLSFIQGAQGLKITYDSFFKYVMNPDTHPSRLSHFLSAILGQNVTIRAVLPTKGTHMAEAGSFSDCRYLGRPAEFYIKTIRLSFGGIDFEYVEPLNKDGGDPFSNWLLEHGEGIHHINVKFADNGVLRENLTELGIPELHSAKMRDKGYAFYDLRETFGFLAEVGEMVVGPMAEAYYAGKEHP